MYIVRIQTHRQSVARSRKEEKKTEEPRENEWVESVEWKPPPSLIANFFLPPIRAT